MYSRINSHYDSNDITNRQIGCPTCSHEDYISPTAEECKCPACSSLYTITDSSVSARERFYLYLDSDKEVGYKAIKSDVIRQMRLRDK